jgi:hypothetical protein
MAATMKIEGDDGVVIEHFRCECGHEWPREMEPVLSRLGARPVSEST